MTTATLNSKCGVQPHSTERTGEKKGELAGGLSLLLAPTLSNETAHIRLQDKGQNVFNIHNSLILPVCMHLVRKFVLRRDAEGKASRHSSSL